MEPAQLRNKEATKLTHKVGSKALANPIIGPKDPKIKASGPIYYTINGIWTLKPDYLGPWTLRARDAGKQNGNNYIIIGAMLGLYTDSGKENGNYHLGFLAYWKG